MVQKTLLPKSITREELRSLVDKAADIIRTATDYKFILVLLFLKRISDTWQEEFEEKKREFMKYLDEKSAEIEAENEVYHTFNLKRDLLWDRITEDIKKLPENLSNALIKIAELNPELKGVVDKFSFLGFTTQEHREKLRQLVELFNQYNFSNKYVSSDVVGDAYEHILYRFAPTQAKEGEVYTPREVIELLVNILDPKPGESVYDPACGSGGMLIISHKYVREKYGKEEKLLLYGQEYNADIYGFCKLNLVAHGITDAFIEFGDSLLYPRFTEGGRLKQFDVVIANIPWNQDGYGEETLKKADFKERFFDYPPNNTADWAWVQHMLVSAKENGRVGLVVDNGCLFRGGAERSIRSKIIEKDWIECVILTPEKLFYNTGAPGAIIIFRKNKPAERKGKILFINASNEYIPHSSVRRLNTLSPENINKIVEAYRKFVDIAGFCRVVNVEEVRKNDYNLNITLYVMPIEKSEQIDIIKEYEELKVLEKERHEVMTRLEQYIMGIAEAMSDRDG
jgi:type I restriction enzyme M protein